MAGEEGKEGTSLSFPSFDPMYLAQTPKGGSRPFRDRHSFPQCLALVGVSHDISALSALILGIKAGTTHHSTKRRTPFVSVGTEKTDEKERVERLFKDDGGRRGKAADDTVHCRFAVKTSLPLHSLPLTRPVLATTYTERGTIGRDRNHRSLPNTEQHTPMAPPLSFHMQLFRDLATPPLLTGRSIHRRTRHVGTALLLHRHFLPDSLPIVSDGRPGIGASPKQPLSSLMGSL